MAMEQLVRPPALIGVRSIAVVDEDAVARAGLERIAREVPGARVVGLTHDDALTHEAWAEVDVVVIDPVDPLRRGDQIPGATVVEHIRSLAGPFRPRIVVVGGHRPDDAVRRRLREAGADAYVDGDVDADPDRLTRIVSGRSPGDPIPDPVDLETLAHLGITDASLVNAGVRAALHERLVPESSWVGPRGTDRLARLERFNRYAQLQPVAVAGQAVQDVPSLAQIQRFVRWATRIDGAG